MAFALLGGVQPAQEHIVYSRQESLEKWAIFITDGEGQEEPRRLVEGSAGLVSPDGRWVAYYNDALFVVPTRGGTPIFVALGVYPRAWTRDSRRVVGNDSGQLVVVDVARRQKVVLDRGVLFGVSLSPDGRKVAYGRSRSGTLDICSRSLDIFVVSLYGGRPRRITRVGGASYPVWGPEGIVFSRMLPGCNYDSGIWIVGPDGGGLRPVYRKAPQKFSTLGYYGFEPHAWIGHDRLLIGIRTEWGPYAHVLDLRTRRIGPFLGLVEDPGRDGRSFVGVQGAAEFPFDVAIVSTDTGRRRYIAHGPVCCVDWNR